VIFHQLGVHRDDRAQAGERLLMKEARYCFDIFAFRSAREFAGV